MSRAGISAWIITTGAAFGAGWFLGWRQQHPPRPPEAPRAAVVHKSGAITLERTNAAPPAPLDLAPGVTARTRAVTVELAPLPTARTLQIDFQEGQDGTRVTVKGEGITGGKDFVIPGTAPGPVKKWTAGAMFDGKAAGPWIAYSTRRITIAAGATKNQAIIMAGIRF